MHSHDLLDALAHHDDRAEEAILAARQNPVVLRSVFARYLVDAAEAPGQNLRDYPALRLVAMLMAEWRAKEACRPLMQILRSDLRHLDRVWGEQLVECGPRLVAAVFDGEVEPIFGFIRDPGCAEPLRANMFRTLTMLALKDRLACDDVASFLRYFAAVEARSAGPALWLGWAQAIAALGREDLALSVRNAYDRGLLDADFYPRALFEAHLQLACDEGPAWFTQQIENQIEVDTLKVFRLYLKH
ncbi:DUF1186 domain-containing protein [Phaeovulum sp. NW3]|uniref:DUF1186 domain-containing protein n=1 Tax=Phaeovulum sp. NW3 TaxID=2934933 RepID=UPI002021DEC8|nr:DUF1186 domain-containing protein [Phaeovulum sp. NW3]MCL7465533.1 DUF1186 domain-containing protein [Phaeovulum sp. NW3]